LAKTLDLAELYIISVFKPDTWIISSSSVVMNMIKVCGQDLPPPVLLSYIVLSCATQTQHHISVLCLADNYYSHHLQVQVHLLTINSSPYEIGERYGEIQYRADKVSQPWR